MKRYDVLTIGSATRDVYLLGLKYDKHQDKHFTTGTGVCLPFGSKVGVPDLFFSTGGAGTNAAVTFARYGYKTGAVYIVGDDVRGQEIRKALEDEKVDTGFAQIDFQKQTAYSIILLAKEGERTIMAYRGAGEALNAKKVPWNKLSARLVYLNSLYGNIDLLRGAVSIKKRHGAKIAWNPSQTDLDLGLPKLLPLLKNVDIFLANQEEMANLLSLPYNQPAKVFRKLDEIIGGIAVMTRGPEGVMVSDGKTLWDAGIFREKRIIDRTGAGDSFGSGFSAALLGHRNRTARDGLVSSDIEYAIRYASANATSKVENLGAKGGLLTKREFLKEKRWKNLKIKKSVL